MGGGSSAKYNTRIFCTIFAISLQYLCSEEILLRKSLNYTKQKAKKVKTMALRFFLSKNDKQMQRIFSRITFLNSLNLRNFQRCQIKTADKWSIVCMAQNLFLTLYKSYDNDISFS